VVLKNDATRLYRDYRLEVDGVLKSSAVTQGPILDPVLKRLAVRAEDPLLGHATFEGAVAKGNVGAAP
jgi:bifunctional non-homologous end joining protein LigD